MSLSRACKMGNEEIVQMLISAGAIYQTNTSNKYSILNEAILHGYVNIVKSILEEYPHSIWVWYDAVTCLRCMFIEMLLVFQDETIEGWSPLHAACIGANEQIIDVILQHKFPPDYYQKRQLSAGVYYSPFDVNVVDAMGQTCLYISCLSGNSAIVEKLLSWRVICQKVVRNDVTVIYIYWPISELLLILFFGLIYFIVFF